MSMANQLPPDSFHRSMTHRRHFLEGNGKSFSIELIEYEKNTFVFINRLIFVAVQVKTPKRAIVVNTFEVKAPDQLGINKTQLLEL